MTSGSQAWFRRLAVGYTAEAILFCSLVITCSLDVGCLWLALSSLADTIAVIAWTLQDICWEWWNSRQPTTSVERQLGPPLLSLLLSSSCCKFEQNNFWKLLDIRPCSSLSCSWSCEWDSLFFTQSSHFDGLCDSSSTPLSSITPPTNSASKALCWN